MVKAIVLDYGEVVSSAPGTHTKRDIAHAFGVDESTITKLMARHIPDFREGKIGENKFWRNLSKDLNRTIPKNSDQLWRQDFSEKLIISENIINWVKTLKKRGVKVAVLSNIIPPYAEIIRKRGGYDEFDPVLNSCDVGSSKPKKEIYEMLISKLGLEPEEIVFADDKPENLVPAQLLGLKTILVTSENQLMSETEKLLADNSF